MEMGYWTSFGLLAASLLALAVGPGLHRLARSRPRMLAGLDAFVIVAIGGLILLEVLPEALNEVGWPAAVAVLFGLVGPGLAERSMARSAHRAHTAALVVAIAGVVLHALFDGVVLHPPCADGSLPHDCTHGAWQASTLAIAVVLHRLPVGLTVWILLRPIYGPRTAAGVLTLLAASTVVGFVLGDWIVGLASSAPIAVFQAFVGGSLLHVVIHRSHVKTQQDPARRRWAIEGGLGAIAGVLLVALLPHDAAHGATGGHEQAHEALSLGATFLALTLESAPALLIGYAAAGLVAVFLPRATIAWMSRGRPASRALRGVAFGLPLPICSCGVIPLYRSLVTRGVPATAAMAFLVATPELGLDAVLLSIPLLGAPMSIARVLAAGVVAVLVGWLVGRVAEAAAPATAAPDDNGAPPTGSVVARLLQAARAGFGEVFESTAPWILLGLLVASVAYPLLESGWLRAVPPALQVPLFALLGMPTYICASGATPLVAVLILQGVSPGAALAFLLTGPATNVTTFGVLKELHGRRVAVLFGASMAGLAIAAGFLTDLALGGTATGFSPEHVHADEAPLLQLLALGALGLVLLVTILRVGPRALLENVFPPHDDEHDEHEEEEEAVAPPEPAPCCCSGACDGGETPKAQ